MPSTGRRRSTRKSGDVRSGHGNAQQQQGQSSAPAGAGANSGAAIPVATSSSSASSSSSSDTAAAAAASSSSASSSQRGNVLRFHHPRHSSAAAADQFIFPPTVFTDATYTSGILVPNNDGGPSQAPTSYVDRRISKDFDGKVYHGTVTDYDANGSKGGGRGLWHVKYDDGDEEDFSRQELDDALNLYDEHEGHVEGNNDISGVDDIEIEIPYEYFGQDHHNVKCNDLPYDYGGNAHLLPVLTEDEAAMWTHKNAAHAAARRRFPLQAVRLLGTITLYFDEELAKGKKGRASTNTLDDLPLFAQSRKYSDKYRSRYVGRSGIPRRAHSSHDKFHRTVSPKQAMAEAMAEIEIEEGTDPSQLPRDVQSQLENRSQQIIQTWKAIKGTRPLRECWDQQHGGFVREALESPNHSGYETGRDEQHVPISILAKWVKGDKSIGVVVTDRAKGRKASLYNGLRHIPTDASSILEALMDLSCPTSLYKVPLITPYAVVRVVKDEGGGRKTSRAWQVRIGVYMNRLLPEVLTASTLHVVMSALDKGSYIVSQPLHMPPMRDRDDPVFESSKYPIVRLGDGKGDDTETLDVDEDDMSVEEEKKEDEGIPPKPRDAAMIGSTRESSTISPFTTKGLLKLMENTGNDISMWPDIARSLSQYLQLDLMLHQQHAVCWMLQMESLGGLGINSVIWEERKFLDGGKFYYSPALGQIRLGRPPVTVGGILADMMGLGKTLEVLCVIASSLEELKREAKEGGKYCTHATLIIVPPALVAQWIKEIKKSCGDKLQVSHLDARAKDLVDVVQQDDPDIVITTYGALELPKTSKYLASYRWGRVVLDEMQEIRSSTTKIAKNCESLDCHRRWMMSGTPIFQGIEDLRGELNFLRLEPYAAKLEDGFFDFSIMSHWNQHSKHGLETLRILGLLMLRRSKDMTIVKTGASIMDQKKLTVEFVPVAQEASERALYCWIEYVVSQELNQKEEDARDLKSRNLCLRLLREICFSVVLLNGGLGVPSQLKTLNTLMVKSNRRNMSEALDADRSSGSSRKRRETNRVMSCDEALRFLTQVQAEANVGEDFVTDVMMGRGQGVTNRNHAMESVEDQVKQAEEEVDRATKEQAQARRKRAKARWHHALELVTTGALWQDHEACGVSLKCASLWKWRYLSTKLDEERDNDNEKNMNLPECLGRGWRPSPSFLRTDLLASHPEFAWAYPFTIRLDNIPPEVAPEDIKKALFEAAKIEAAKRETKAKLVLEELSEKLEKARDTRKEDRLQAEFSGAKESLNRAIAHAATLKEPTVVKLASANAGSSTGTWIAFVHLSDGEFEKSMHRASSTAAGICLQSKVVIPHIQAALEQAMELHDQAESENKVYPCAANKKHEVEARKALNKAKLGLRIKFDDPSTASTSNVIMSRAVEPYRNLDPRSKDFQIDRCSRNIAECTDILEGAAARIESERSKLARLMPALGRGLSQDVAKLSAFEIIEALKEREKEAWEKTCCPICLSPFGSTADDSEASFASSKPVVAMTSCGHFFCIECIEDHVQRSVGRISCPNCRRAFCPSQDVIHIDHTQDDSEEYEEKRNEAKAKVRQASDMLESSNGIIDGGLWHALFLSIDLPAHVSTRAHHIHTALPHRVLSHMRAATGMKVDCSRSETPTSNEESSQQNAGLSSKIKALLRDLPLGEHSVVFSSSKEGVIHLATVIEAKGVVCFSLYTGQNAKTTEEAVSSWEKMRCDKSKPGPVLVVQAGAAASGLTLTAASKLFLMEPFSRFEEEQQAYARCHRYGQRNDVDVKIYYAPVSVESRLLEWRKQAAKKMPGSSSANYVFTELFDDDKEDSDAEVNGDDDDESDVEMINQDIDGGGDDEQEDAQTNEDNMRTQFLLGLVDANGNPIGAEEKNDDEEDGEEEDNDSDHRRRASARRFVYD